MRVYIAQLLMPIITIYLSVAAHLKIVKELFILSNGTPIKELMKLKCITRIAMV